jgi:hypothetical protein
VGIGAQRVEHQDIEPADQGHRRFGDRVAVREYANRSKRNPKMPTGRVKLNRHDVGRLHERDHPRAPTEPRDATPWLPYRTHNQTMTDA